MSFFAKLKTYRELIVYCIIGGTGATLDFIIYSLLTKGVGIHYQVANIVSVSAGIINNFFWNYYCNFKAKDKLLKRLGSFYTVGMFGCMLSALLLWIFIERFGITPIVAKLGTIVFVTVVQFLLNKFVTFKQTKEADNGR